VNYHPPNDALGEIAVRCKSPRLGPFYEHRELRVLPDFDFLFASTVEVCNVAQEKLVTAAGGAFTRLRASTSAIGEAIERLGLCTYPSERVIWSPYAALMGGALDPQSCLHYPEDVYQRPEFGIARYSPDTFGAWISAMNLTTGESSYVPAVFAFNQTPADFPQEALWDRPLSTGAACALEQERAVLTGLYELIERDALMIHWENRLPCVCRPTTDPVCAAIKAKGFDIHLVELPTDLGATVALAAIIDPTGVHATLGVGAAARATWGEAAYRALEEAILSVMWITNRRQWQPMSLAMIKAELAGIPDPVLHADFYGYETNVSRCSFLWEQSEEHAPGKALACAPFGTVTAELAALRAHVESSGREIIVVDITPSEAQEFGFTVVRVIVPGLVPLGRGVHARPTMNARLRRAAPDGYFIGNTDPHPLP
jgi:ribosomal protein S12 methylthiotransferase accessory factor